MKAQTTTFPCCFGTITKRYKHVIITTQRRIKRVCLNQVPSVCLSGENRKLLQSHMALKARFLTPHPSYNRTFL